MITIDAKATEKAKAMLAKLGKPCLRLSVVSSGCSGLTYDFKPEEAPSPTDMVIEADGFKLLVDRKSLLYVAGSEITFEQSLMASGFRVKNPNSAGSCACGTSFTV